MSNDTSDQTRFDTIMPEDRTELSNLDMRWEQLQPATDLTQPSIDLHFDFKLRIRELIEESKWQNGQVSADLKSEAARLALHGLKDASTAERLLTEAATEGGLTPLRCIDLANASEDFLRVNETLRQLAVRQPPFSAASTWLLASDLNYKAKRLSRAIECCQEALQDSPGDTYIELKLSSLLAQANKWVELERLLKSQSDQANGIIASHLHLKRGKLLQHKLQDPVAAVEAFQSALVANPNNDAAKVALIQICWPSRWFNEMLSAFSPSKSVIWNRLSLFAHATNSHNPNELLQHLENEDEGMLFWLRIRNMIQAGHSSDYRLLLNKHATESTKADAAISSWLMFLEQPDENIEARISFLITALKRDPQAFCAIEELMQIWDSAGETGHCVELMNNAAKAFDEIQPDIALWCRATGAAIALTKLDKPLVALQMLGETHSGPIGILKEMTLIALSKWESLAELYIKRADATTAAGESAHWLLQAGRIHENQLKNFELALSLYSRAKNVANTSMTGLTDSLRVFCQHRAWNDVSKLLAGEQESADHLFIAALMLRLQRSGLSSAGAILMKLYRKGAHDILALIELRQLYARASDLRNGMETSIELSKKVGCRAGDWMRFSFLHHLDTKNAELRYRLLSSCRHLSPAYLMGMALGATESGAHIIMNHLKKSKQHMDLDESLFFLFEAIDVQDQVGVKDIFSQLMDFPHTKTDFDALACLAEACIDWRIAYDLREKQESHLSERARMIASKQPQDAVAAWSAALHMHPESVVSALSLIDIGDPKKGRMSIEAHQLLAKESSHPKRQAFHQYMSADSRDGATFIQRLSALIQTQSVIQELAFNQLTKVLARNREIQALTNIYQARKDPDWLRFSEEAERIGAYAQCSDVLESIITEKSQNGLHDDRSMVELYRVEWLYEKSEAWLKLANTMQRRLKVWKSPKLKNGIIEKLKWIMVEKLADRPEALALYKELHEQSPDDPAILEALARIAIGQGDTESAVLYLRQLMQNADTPKAAARYHFRIAEAFMADNDPDGAKYALHDALDLNLNDSEARQMLIEIYTNEENWPALVGWLGLASSSLTGEDQLICLRKMAMIYEEKLFNLDLALERWNMVLEIEPSDTKTLFHLMKLSKARLDYTSMFKTAEQLLNTQEGDNLCQTLCELAIVCHEALIRDDQAEKYLRQSLQINPLHQQTLTELKRLFIAQERHDELPAILLNLADVSTDENVTLDFLHQAQDINDNLLNDEHLTFELSSRISKIDSHDIQAEIDIALKKWHDGDLELGAEMLASIESKLATDNSQPLDSKRLFSYHCTWGEIQLSRKEPEAASKSFQEALSIQPKSSQALEGIATAYFMGKNWEKATSAYQALKDTPALERQISTDELSHKIGVCCLHLEDIEKAIQELEKAVSQQPEEIAYQHTLAMAYIKHKDWDSAISAYQKSLESPMADEDAIVHGIINKAYILDRELNMTDVAEAHYRQGLQYAPQNSRLNLCMAELYSRAKSWHALEQLLQPAMQHAPSDEKGLMYLLMSASAMARHDGQQAQTCFNKACRLNGTIVSSLGEQPTIDAILALVQENLGPIMA